MGVNLTLHQECQLNRGPRGQEPWEHYSRLIPLRWIELFQFMMDTGLTAEAWNERYVNQTNLRTSTLTSATSLEFTYAVIEGDVSFRNLRIAGPTEIIKIEEWVKENIVPPEHHSDYLGFFYGNCWTTYLEDMGYKRYPIYKEFSNIRWAYWIDGELQ